MAPRSTFMTNSPGSGGGGPAAPSWDAQVKGGVVLALAPLRAVVPETVGVRLSSLLSWTARSVVTGVGVALAPLRAVVPETAGVALSSVLSWTAPSSVVGVRLSGVLSWTARSVVTGVTVALAPLRAVVPETAGAVVTARVVAATVRPSFAAGVLMATTPTTPKTPPAAKLAGGGRLVQTTYQLTRRTGINSTVASGAGWTNPNNENGLHDGVLATMPSSLTAAQSGTLTGSYVDPDSSKAQFTIVSVKVWQYAAIVTDPLAGANLLMRYSSNLLAQNDVPGSFTAGAFTSLVGGRSFDITSIIAGNWANLAGFKIASVGNTAMAGTATIEIDAVELEIVTATLVTPQ